MADKLCQDLFKILPAGFDMTDHCGESYWRWEERVDVWLRNNGYTVDGWFSIESDSFGPLIRGVNVVGPHGEEKTLSYG